MFWGEKNFECVCFFFLIFFGGSCFWIFFFMEEEFFFFFWKCCWVCISFLNHNSRCWAAGSRPHTGLLRRDSSRLYTRLYALCAWSSQINPLIPRPWRDRLWRRPTPLPVTRGFCFFNNPPDYQRRMKKEGSPLFLQYIYIYI